MNIGTPAITSLAGLEALLSIGGLVLIIDNPALTSLTGLDNLATVGGDLNIWGNDALCSSVVDAFAARFPANVLTDSFCYYYYGFNCSYNDDSC